MERFEGLINFGIFFFFGVLTSFTFFYMVFFQPELLVFLIVCTLFIGLFTGFAFMVYILISGLFESLEINPGRAILKLFKKKE